MLRPLVEFAQGDVGLMLFNIGLILATAAYFWKSHDHSLSIVRTSALFLGGVIGGIAIGAGLSLLHDDRGESIQRLITRGAALGAGLVFMIVMLAFSGSPSYIPQSQPRPGSMQRAAYRLLARRSQKADDDTGATDRRTN